MKRLLLITAFLVPALVGMEPASPSQELQLIDEKSALQKGPSFDFKKYVNVRKLFTGILDSFFTDEDKVTSGLENDSLKSKNESADTMRQLINIFINALKLEQRVLTIELPSLSEVGEIPPKKTIQIQLTDLCDVKKLRELLIAVNDDFFQKNDKETKYGAKLIKCIKWGYLKKALGEQSDAYVILKSSADIFSNYSKSSLDKIDIAECLNIQRIIKLLFGFDLTTYADMPAVHKLINTLFKGNQTSLGMCAQCVNPLALLAFLGWTPEEAEEISNSVQGLCMFLHDLVEEGPDATINKMLGALALYNDQDNPQLSSNTESFVIVPNTESFVIVPPTKETISSKKNQVSPTATKKSSDPRSSAL